MGQGLSCRGSNEHGLFRAVQHGDLETVATLLHTHPTLMHRTTVYDHHSSLHIAAANGQIQVGWWLPLVAAQHLTSPIGFLIFIFIGFNLWQVAGFI